MRSKIVCQIEERGHIASSACSSLSCASSSSSSVRCAIIDNFLRCCWRVRRKGCLHSSILLGPGWWIGTCSAFISRSSKTSCSSPASSSNNADYVTRIRNEGVNDIKIRRTSSGGCIIRASRISSSASLPRSSSFMISSTFFTGLHIYLSACQSPKPGAKSGNVKYAQLALHVLERACRLLDREHCLLVQVGGFQSVDLRF